MDIKQLKYFVSIVDQKSFSKAAKDLNVSQPALSLSIRNLEREMGSQLLVRTRTEVSLTGIGEQFLPHARVVLREVEKAEEVFVSAQSEKRHTVKVGLSSLFSDFLAKDVFVGYYKDHPDVRVEIEITAHELDIAVDRISSGLWDFGVILRSHGSSVPKNINIEHCLDLTSSVYASKKHPLAKRASVSLEDLSDYAWFMSTLTDGRAIIAKFRDAGLDRPNIVGRANSFNFIMALVRNGDLITILPNEIVKNYYGDSLTRLKTDEFNFQATVDIIYAKDSEETKPARHLKKRIDGFFRSHE
jgi:DNA-binding transcriptional LysR family regulator